MPLLSPLTPEAILARVIAANLVAAVLVVSLLIFQHRSHKRRLISTDPVLHHLRAGTPTIVYFSTPGTVLNSAGRAMQKVALHEVQAELENTVQIVQIDVGKEPEAAQRWGISTTPATVILDAHGKARHVNRGMVSAKLLKEQLFDSV